MKMLNYDYLCRNYWNRKCLLSKLLFCNCRPNGFTYNVNQEAVSKILDMFGKCSLVNLKRASQVMHIVQSNLYVRCSAF